MQISVISLTTALARRARVEHYFANSPYPWRFMDACTGDTVTIAYDPVEARRLMGRDLTPSEIGCAGSHIRVLEEFVANGGSDTLLVCEDDIFIDFDFTFPDLIKAMQEAGIDYFKLYSSRIPPAKHIRWWRNRWLVRYRWEPLGAQAYLVTRRGAERLLAMTPRIFRESDQQIDRFWETGMPLYTLFPHPVIELSAPTTIKPRNAPPTKFHLYRHKLRRFVDRTRAVRDSFGHTQEDRRFYDALTRRDEELIAARAAAAPDSSHSPHTA